jgi:hypothetical protein
MLTFTHTYVLSLAYQKLNHQEMQFTHTELILGNVIPDFITHLGRDRFQAMAHDLNRLVSSHQKSMLEWGAIFHILCDNYSTLGRITFTGNYYDLPKNGFIEQLSRAVKINLSLQIPKRRILQIVLDIRVIRANRSRLIAMLRSAAAFLEENFLEIANRIATIYALDPDQLKIGLNRFLEIYCRNFIEQSASEEYRLFALARSLLNLHSLTDPQIILKSVKNHPELMELVELNMGLINENWQELLENMVQHVLEFPGMRAIFQKS